MKENRKRDSIEVSVVIIVRNEEIKLPDCLRSVKKMLVGLPAGRQGEIVAIDNNSTDKTASISRKAGVRVFTTSDKLTLKYSDLRNLGLKKAKGKWIFYVDADERVTPELKNEILRLTSFAQDDVVVAYAIPRRNVIFGREFKHGGLWPDYVKRLFLKKKLEKWTGDVHEEPVFEGEMGHLESPLVHMKHDNLEEMVEKTNKWSEIEAKLMFDANHPKMNIIRFTTAMFREFWLRMIKQLAFLDGAEGIIYALYQVYSRFISYAKLWEMQLKTENR